MAIKRKPVIRKRSPQPKVLKFTTPTSIDGKALVRLAQSNIMFSAIQIIEDGGDNNDRIDVESIEGDESKIAFNSRYLQEVLSVFERGQIALETTTPSSPGVFRPVDSEDYVHVVMPMFVQW